MKTTGYFDPHPQTRPRVLAHRGLTFENNKQVFDENTLEAFARALEVGADFLESDIHVTKDQIPVLFHDRDLRRLTGKKVLISEINFAELDTVSLEKGGKIPSLKAVLTRFPEAKFNLDIKTKSAETAAIQAIAEAGAFQRVLITSFSDRSRLRALAMSPTPLASSAGSSTVLASYLAARLGQSRQLKKITSEISALQIPTVRFGIDFTHPKFLEAVLPLDVEIHYWTINDVKQMEDLFNLGAHGIVTDRADLAVAHFS